MAPLKCNSVPLSLGLNWLVSLEVGRNVISVKCLQLFLLVNVDLNE
jgi:hypothetical protein